MLTNNNTDIQSSLWFIDAIMFGLLPISIKNLFQRVANEMYPSLEEIQQQLPKDLRL